MEEVRCVIRREPTPAGLVVRLRVSGVLDRAAHPEVRRALHRAFERHRRATIVVDLAEAEHIGSECIEVLLVAYTRALRAGHGFEVVNPHGAVRQALEITGLCARGDDSPLYARLIDLDEYRAGDSPVPVMTEHNQA
ncbi:STAS domain-containing protein [Actinoplanes sp. NPDC024001]|uniref:STAS domain-containing protein n=1 Tax=Actinoplanes sp. NPDC024001 TaxID=3154598 RepID=UPI0033D0785A